ncbi:MAG: hypothetical protein II851_01165 [Bacteroidales bacterium]|jgi:hypothetical protein|nr:hypothetical protein [Bacteroidales bacterium]
MGIFNMFGEQEHRVFNYKPIYYDEKKEERKRMFGAVDGSLDREMEKAKEDGTYVPGSFIKESMREGRERRTRSHANKAQNIIGLVGLLLIFIVLFYIAKFYTLL